MNSVYFNPVILRSISIGRFPCKSITDVISFHDHHESVAFFYTSISTSTEVGNVSIFNTSVQDLLC